MSIMTKDGPTPSRRRFLKSAAAAATVSTGLTTTETVSAHGYAFEVEVVGGEDDSQYILQANGDFEALDSDSHDNVYGDTVAGMVNDGGSDRFATSGNLTVVSVDGGDISVDHYMVNNYAGLHPSRCDGTLDVFGDGDYEVRGLESISEKSDVENSGILNQQDYIYNDGCSGEVTGGEDLYNATGFISSVELTGDVNIDYSFSCS